GGSIPAGDLVLVTRQLAMLIQSGATIEEAIGAIASQAERPVTRRVLLDVRAQLQEGYSLSDALATSAGSFPAYYRSVVSAGLLSGRLGEVLERLAQHLEKTRKLRGKIMAALIYPAVLSVVALTVVGLLMVFVVPAVVDQFDTMDQELPALTNFVISISNFLQHWGWWLLAITGVAGWGAGRLLGLPQIKRRWDQFALRLPLIGRVLKLVNAAQFARTFATLSSSGATVPEALHAATGSVRNEVFRQASIQVRREVEEGRALHAGLRATTVFPAMLIHMVASGERGSDLPQMMGLAADYIEEELDRNSTVAIGLLEPALIVCLAGVVAMIVMAIMLPILQLNTLAIGA
ncbi:MAG: type II secretion system F family protein, partial [Henriciella sp.]